MGSPVGSRIGSRMGSPCRQCGCTTADDGGAHALQAMLLAGDLDAALTHGLLDVAACPGCNAECMARLLGAREQRRFALAARARHEARAARLIRRKAEREAARRPAPAAAAQPRGLPAGAAAVLARAVAKAADRKPR